MRAEGVVDANRTWPVNSGRLRSDLPPGWVAALLPPLMRHAAEDLPDLSPAQAADVVVDTLLRGVGAPLLAAR
ncbi:hypothetical protein EDD99_5754 [Streptomyces sp. 846.5]|nr:hypothetical protein [Streptomyces sp. 846.5]TDT97601.1 hypothetical protein EDD99_5754 [Streptomyces sp. 846.5]